jgi:hypothetical protein
LHPPSYALVRSTCTQFVNTTRYCEYSQVLLMMGETIARNM